MWAGQLGLGNWTSVKPYGDRQQTPYEHAWEIGICWSTGKDCFGLDQCQARLYTAILRRAVLVMAALAICAVTAALLKTVPIPRPRPRLPLIRPRRPNQA
jgi:hypothetical protein